MALTWRLNIAAAPADTHAAIHAAAVAWQAAGSPGKHLAHGAARHEGGREDEEHQRRADFADKQRQQRTEWDNGPGVGAG